MRQLLGEPLKGIELGFFKLSENIVNNLGYKFYDCEFNKHSFTLTVYFDVESSKDNINILDTCSIIDKAFSPYLSDDFDENAKKIATVDFDSSIVPDNIVLEVSTPGVYRKLRMNEHLNDAIGKRVKVKFYKKENNKKMLDGDLINFNDEEATININGNNFTYNIKNIKNMNLEPHWNSISK